MNKKVVMILVTVAAAGASIFALTKSNPVQDEPIATFTPRVILTETPSPTAEYKPCYFVWATQELPEISADFQSAVQATLPEAEARANAYGENCVAEDGSYTFGAMETDFYVTIPVADLTNKETLGAIVEQVLVIVIEQFPHPIVPGPQDGFVEFSFVAGTETHILLAPISLASELLEKGLRGAELLEALETQ